MASSKWQISYGDSSSASGTVGKDKVTLGGLTISEQAIELANKMSDQFIQGTGDGLLGLAFGSINTVTPTPVATPVENMITEKDIPASAELFTAKLGSWRDANEPDKGEVSFPWLHAADELSLYLSHILDLSIHYEITHRICNVLFHQICTC